MFTANHGPYSYETLIPVLPDILSNIHASDMSLGHLSNLSKKEYSTLQPHLCSCGVIFPSEIKLILHFKQWERPDSF